MKLIIADLDGSIINNNKISAADIQSIENWISGGDCFTISTGRPFSRTIKIIDELKITMPVVLCNGAAIYTVNEATEILKSINTNDVKSMLHFLNQEKILVNCIIYYGCKTQLLHANQYLLRKVTEWGIDYNCIDDIQDIINEPILMISFYNPSDEMKNSFQHFSELFSIECLSSNYIDILPTGINKGYALKKILNNCAFTDIYVIGDSCNDLSMVFGSNKLVAVENADQEIIDKAYMVINSNKNNPVSDLINAIRSNKNGNI